LCRCLNPIVRLLLSRHRHHRVDGWSLAGRLCTGLSSFIAAFASFDPRFPAPTSRVTAAVALLYDASSNTLTFAAHIGVASNSVDRLETIAHRQWPDRGRFWAAAKIDRSAWLRGSTPFASPSAIPFKQASTAIHAKMQ